MADASFAKLRDGSWGLRTDGIVTAGDVVTVRKKDGSTQQKKVGRIVFKGADFTLCTIDGEGGDGSVERKCKSCGVRESSLRKPYEKILRSGECSGCYRDRKDGYDD